MPRGSKPKTYPQSLVDQVATLYDDGLTQAEIAQRLNLTQKVIWNLMRRHEINARPAARRDQRGERNPNWRGDTATYAALHYRVTAAFGQPTCCNRCGTEDPSKSYDWANLTGKYHDPSDYERLCRSCHRRYDAERR